MRFRRLLSYRYYASTVDGRMYIRVDELRMPLESAGQPRNRLPAQMIGSSGNTAA